MLRSVSTYSPALRAADTTQPSRPPLVAYVVLSSRLPRRSRGGARSAWALATMYPSPAWGLLQAAPRASRPETFVNRTWAPYAGVYNTRIVSWLLRRATSLTEICLPSYASGAKGKEGGLFTGTMLAKCAVCGGCGRQLCPRCDGAGLENSWLYQPVKDGGWGPRGQ
eukprot:SM000024S07805  [mRNA]  locus=s24:662846:663697:+ [translate_table: standard]